MQTSLKVTQSELYFVWIDLTPVFLRNCILHSTLRRMHWRCILIVGELPRGRDSLMTCKRLGKSEIVSLHGKDCALQTEHFRSVKRGTKLMKAHRRESDTIRFKEFNARVLNSINSWLFQTDASLTFQRLMPLKSFPGGALNSACVYKISPPLSVSALWIPTCARADHLACMQRSVWHLYLIVCVWI